MNVDTHHVLAYAEATTPTDELHSQVEDFHSDIKLLHPFSLSQANIHFYLKAYIIFHKLCDKKLDFLFWCTHDLFLMFW